MFEDALQVEQKQFVFYSLYFFISKRNLQLKERFCQHTVLSKANKLALLQRQLEYKMKKDTLRAAKTDREEDVSRDANDISIRVTTEINVQSLCFLFDMK